MKVKVPTFLQIEYAVAFCLAGLLLGFMGGAALMTYALMPEEGIKIHGKLMRPEYATITPLEMEIGEVGYIGFRDLEHMNKGNLSDGYVSVYRMPSDGFTDIKIQRTKDGYEVWLPDRLRADAKEN